jgi:hypothetical protein
LIQLELDGRPSARQVAWLTAHLASCPACREYAAGIAAVDAALRRDAERQRAADLWQAAYRPALLNRPVPVNPRRFPVSTQPWKSFASTLVSLTLMAVVAVGLVILISTSVSSLTPLSAPAVSAPTPTPPVATHDQILAALDAFAQQDAAAYTGTQWVHRIQQNLNEEGSGGISGAFVEEWIHLVAGACQETLTISRDRPNGEQLYNLILGLPDGTQGDLVELRDGREVGPGSLLTDWRCAITPASTDAGRMAARLRGEGAVKGPNEVQALSARYETQDGPSVLAVNVTFSGAGNIPEVAQVEQRYDLASGRLVMEKTVATWADGRPFSEVSRNQTVEFVDALPTEVGTLWAQAAAELLAYRDPAARPTATPFATAAPDFLDGLTAFTQNAPLTQPASIQAALQALLVRHNEWLAQPGWVLHQPRPGSAPNWDATYAALLHTLPNGNCEQMSFYVKDGQVLPQRLDLANGSWGVISPVTAGGFTEGGRGAQHCQIENYYTLNMLQATLIFVNSVVAGSSQQALQLWVEERTSGSIVVLASDETYAAPQPLVEDPDTGKLEPQTRSQSWTFFDLRTGAYLGADLRSYLANGKVIGDGYEPGADLPQETLRSDAPPPELAAAFERARAALTAYLAAQP